MDVSDIFFFFCSARGEGGVRGARGGGLKIPGGGGGHLKIPGGGGVPGGAGRVSAANRGIGGGGLNFFFGAETSTKNSLVIF